MLVAVVIGPRGARLVKLGLAEPVYRETGMLLFALRRLLRDGQSGAQARRRGRRAIGGGAVRAASPGAVVGAAYRGNVRRAVGDVLGPRPPRRSFPRSHGGGPGGGPWVAG